jgi:hypothetical protein
VNSRATRAGRTALRAVERDDDPETQAPLVHQVFVFPDRRHAPPPAGRPAPDQPSVTASCSPASCETSGASRRLAGEGMLRFLNTHVVRALSTVSTNIYLSAVRVGIRRRVVGYFEYRTVYGFRTAPVASIVCVTCMTRVAPSRRVTVVSTYGAGPSRTGVRVTSESPSQVVVET